MIKLVSREIKWKKTYKQLNPELKHCQNKFQYLENRRNDILAIQAVSKDFLKKVSSLVDSEENRARFFEALRQYHQSSNIKRLVHDLKRILQTIAQYSLFEDLRALIPEEHHRYYDKHVKLNKKGERLVRIKKGSTELMGFTFRGGKEHGIGFFITSITKGSIADNIGLKVGDELRKVNGLPLYESLHHEVLSIFRNNEAFNLVVKYDGKIPDKINDEMLWRQIDIFDRSTAKRQSPISERCIILDTTDSKDLRCREDENGSYGVQEKDEDLKDSSDDKIALERSAYEYPSVDGLDGREMFVIAIEKDGALGMNLELKNDKIVVHDVLSSGAADRHGFLIKGDWILSCEGYDLMNISLSQAQTIISMVMQRWSKHIEFVIACPRGRKPPESFNEEEEFIIKKNIVNIIENQNEESSSYNKSISVLDVTDESKSDESDSYKIMQSIESNHADMPNNEMFDKSTEYSNFAKESNNLPHLDATNECNRGSEKPDCSLDKLTDILLTDARINADDKIVKYCAETSHRDKEPASPNRRKKKKTKRGKPWNTKVISFDKKNKQTRNFIDKILTSDKSHCQEGNVYYDMWKTDHPTQFTSDLLLMISNNDTNIQCQKLEETNYQLLKFKKNIKSSFFPDETNDSEENITNSTKKNCIVNENGTIDQLNSSQDTTMIEITTEDSKVITRLNLIEKTDDKIDIQSIVMHCEDEGSQCEVSGQVCEELIKPEQLEYDHLERDAVNDMLKNLKDDIIDESKQSVEKVDKNKNITFNDNMHLDSTDKLRDDIDRVSDESIETKILHQVGLTENMNSKKEDIKPVVQPVSIEKSEKDTSVNTVDEGLSMMDLPMMGVNSPDKTNSLIENESSLDIAKKDAEPEYVKIKPSNSLSNETLDIDMVIDGQLKYNAKTTDTRQYGEVDNFAKPSVTIQNKKETNGTFASPFFLGKLNEAPKNLFTDEEIAGFQRFKEESNRFLLNTPLHSYSEETKLNGWKQKNISSKKEQGASKELFKSERSKKLPSNDSQEEYVIRTLNELKSVFDDSTTPSCRNKIMMYQNSGITNHFEHELGNFLSFSPQKKINMAGKKVSNIYFNDHSVDIQRENDTIYSYASNIQLPSLSKEINHPSSGKTINQVDTSLHALPNIQQDYGIGNYGNVFNDTLSDDSSLSPSPRSPTGKEVRSILMKHRKTSPKKVKFNNKVFIGTAYQAGEYSSTNIVPVYAKNNNQIIKLESIYIDQIPSTSLNSKLNRFAKRDVDVSTTMKIKASSENMNKSGVSKISNFVEKNNSDFIKITNLDG